MGETRPGGVTVAASYDGYGRLLTYARAGDPAQSNVYNGLDDRVSATSAAVTHRFVYDGDGRVMGEYGTSPSDVIAETIWLSPADRGCLAHAVTPPSRITEYQHLQLVADQRRLKESARDSGPIDGPKRSLGASGRCTGAKYVPE